MALRVEEVIDFGVVSAALTPTAMPHNPVSVNHKLTHTSAHDQCKTLYRKLVGFLATVVDRDRT